MAKTMSKSGLAIALSKLESFKNPQVMKEQYMMDSEIGASVLWNALLLGDIEGKVIADFGCGTGVLGLGALLLGAKSVLFIDSEKKALETAKYNASKLKSEEYNLGKAEFVCSSIAGINLERVDTVLQNPPFGTKSRHADAIFLEKALETGNVVYSFHKSETLGFLERFSAKKRAKITHAWNFRFPLKASYHFHRRQIHRIDAICIRIKMQE